MGCDESHLIVPTIESKVNKSRNNVRSKGNTRDLGSEVDSIKKPKSHHKSKQAETMDTRELDENSNFGGFKAKAKRSKSAKQIYKSKGSSSMIDKDDTKSMMRAKKVKELAVTVYQHNFISTIGRNKGLQEDQSDRRSKNEENDSKKPVAKYQKQSKESIFSTKFYKYSTPFESRQNSIKPSNYLDPSVKECSPPPALKRHYNDIRINKLRDYSDRMNIVKKQVHYDLDPLDSD